MGLFRTDAAELKRGSSSCVPPHRSGGSKTVKVAELLRQRRGNWHELDDLCTQMETKRRKKIGAEAITRFAALYRSTCADLALASAYQLPRRTVQYLHRLVGRAHNQLYRSRSFDFQAWQALVHRCRIFNRTKDTYLEVSYT